MPLDTSTTYRLTRLRLDGRRWNELRFIQAQISTNPASSGSSYLAMGNTVVVCNVHGPAEGKRSEASGAGGGGAVVSVVVNIAGFAGIDRKKKSMVGGGGGGDRQATTELSSALRDAFQPHLHTHIYPHSTISIHVSVLSSDGSIFAACINACTLALVDAGIPMPGLLCACTVGMSGRASTPATELTRPPPTSAPAHIGGINESLDPLLDMSHPEELELPHMTVANTNPIAGAGAFNGADDDEAEAAAEEEEEEAQMLSIVRMESGVHISYLETMFAVGIDGCKQMRQILNGVLKGAGRKVLEGEAHYSGGADMVDI
ncbi:Exosome non-catalytic core component [Emydomyces testavorans]|uniref:Exosome non-catalytic core component n=1 Tax=Emydomyces testavorans TaxID=2070801 RepID=A0AAF0IJ92_9EURO|nr:Exosome non-catalytic core component [Emydomyces testavorans]